MRRRVGDLLVHEPTHSESLVHGQGLRRIVGEGDGHLRDDERKDKPAKHHHAARDDPLQHRLRHDVTVSNGGERLNRPVERRDVQFPGSHLPPRVILAREVVHGAVRARHPVRHQRERHQQLKHGVDCVMLKRHLLVALEHAHRAEDAKQLEQTQRGEEMERPLLTVLAPHGSGARIRAPTPLTRV